MTRQTIALEQDLVSERTELIARVGHAMFFYPGLEPSQEIGGDITLSSRVAVIAR